MDNKGQGISLDVIIIAAIVLIVLIVLVAIFLGSPVTSLQGDIKKVAPQELIKIQAFSPSRCKPSKLGIESMKLGLSDLSEAEYEQQYDTEVRSLIDRCAGKVSVTVADLSNRDRCNNVRECTYI